MKKLFLLLISLFCIANTWAYSFKVGAIYYDKSTRQNNTTYVIDTVCTVTYGTTTTPSYNATRTDYSGAVVIPSSVTYNGRTYPVVAINQSAFTFCKNISTVSIPSTVTYYTYDSSNYLQSLESYFSNGSYSSFSSFFSGCSSLTSITIDAANTVLSSDNGVVFNKAKTILAAYPPAKTGAYSIPTTVTLVQNGSFINCTGLTALSIPSSVTEIFGYSNPFSGCSNLASITVDAANTVFSSANGVLFNKDKTRLITYPAGNTSNSYTITSSVHKVEMSAFANCLALKTLTITGDSVNIQNTAFEGCKNITKITCNGKYPPTSDQAADIFGYDELSKAMIYAQTRLSVPAASFKLYRLMEPWKNFDTEAYDFDMVVVPATSAAAFTWTPTTGAEKYNLTVCRDAANTDTVCVLTFNAYGQLSALALRSTSTDSVSYVGGFSFTVTSLGSNSNYYYSMDAINSSNQVVANKTGNFRTASAATDLSDAATDKIKVFVQNGQAVLSQIPVGANIVMYNLQGNKIFSAKADSESQQISLPTRGMYIVKVGNESVKVVY